MRSTTIGRQAGFSLVELLVSMVLVSLVLGVAFELFNSTNKLSRAQLHQADLQQSSRVAQRDLLRVARMAGRGGLPGYAVAGLNPASAPASVTPAIEVRNNITTADQRLVPGNATSPLVVAGSDVVTVRGHFTSGPVFVNSTDPSVFQTNPPNGGRITIASIGPTGIPQNIAPLVDAVDEERPDAILIVSSLTDLIYGVAEIDPANSNIAGYDPDPLVYSEVTIAYKHSGGMYSDEYGLLSASGVFPDINVDHPDWLPPRELSNVGMVALLEEYRYYVRVPEPPEVGTAPRLSIGRFYPGTQIPHPDGGWQSDIADNIYDLQAALGFDSSFDGAGSTNGFFDFDPDNTGDDDIIVDGELVAGATTGLDDWLFNDAADTTNLGAPPWTPLPASGTDPPVFPINQPRPRLYYVRLSTLSLAGSTDRGYLAPLITNIEDNVYPDDDDDPHHPVNGYEGRQKRRLLLTTIVDLRNI